MAFATKGSDFRVGNNDDYTTTSTWVSVGCIVDITPPTLTQEMVDVPSCLNDLTAVKQKVPGDIDYGTASFTIQYAAGTIDTLKTYLNTKKAWSIKLNSTVLRAVAFNGYISSIGMPTLAANGFIQVTGTITLASDFDEITIVS